MITAAFAALGVSIYAVERLVPFPFPVGRWGLSNYPVLTMLFLGSGFNAFLIVIVKSVVGSLIVGGFLTPTFAMGFVGGTCAVLTMWSLRSRLRGLSIAGVSVIGASVNNFVQVLVASALVGSLAPMAYLPWLLTIGEVSAIVNAYLTWKTIAVVRRGVL